MKRTAIYFLVLFSAVGVMLIARAACETESIHKANIEYLSSLGYEVGTFLESAPARYDSPDDNVFKNYNELQLQAGFDLEPYIGADMRRYTYSIKNLPDCEDEEVRADLLVFNRRIVGGDIMIVRIDGFMLPLLPIDEIHTATGIFISRAWYL